MSNNEIESRKDQTKQVSEFTNSQVFKTWKKDIAKRRLETIDKLLSSGEWISNTQMIKAVNELYLEAPNDDCYYSSAPHRIIESKEGGKKKFEKALYLYFQYIVRQDRYKITSILKLLGKEHIYERLGGDGVEGAYRYNIKYSIFDKHSVYDGSYTDYEIFNENPPVEVKGDDTSKTEQAGPSAEESEHIEQLDFPTIQALQRLKKAMVDLRRIRDINNYYVSNLLEKAYSIYDSGREGWATDYLRTLINAYDVASNPDSGFDKVKLMMIRALLISAKDYGSDYSGILTLLRKQHEDLLSLDSVPDCFSEAEILYLIRHFIFETYEWDEMVKELGKYYEACINEGKVIMDGDLHFALKCLCYSGPQKWEYNERLLSIVEKLIAFFFNVDESDYYVTGMLVSFFYLKLNIEAVYKGDRPITEDEIVDLYVDHGWEHPMFEI
jgi:hypothetical protein